MNDLENELWRHFGYRSFRPHQKKVIESVLNGKDTIAVLPTGSGKSLCYQLPAKLMTGLTIVVSPLVSLMEDQVIQMRAKGEKHIAHLSSLLTKDERRFVLKHLEQWSLLFVSPEMLSQQWLIDKLTYRNVSLFVVDEAHCISQWGHEFRTDYLRLADVRQKLGQPVCLALTATATAEVEKDIISKMNMIKSERCRAPVNRENIYLQIDCCENEEQKQRQFINDIQHAVTPAICYTGTRRDAEDYSRLAGQTFGMRTAYYHGGVSKEDRIMIQQQFLNNELDMICATNAFGMGIDKSDIRSIFHLYIPQSVEQYIQETGRAGRDGKQSAAKMIVTEDDAHFSLRMLRMNFPDNHLIDGVFPGGQYHGSSWQEASEYAGLDDVYDRMLHFYLEHSGALKDGIWDYTVNTDQVKFNMKERFQRRRYEKEHQFTNIYRFLNKEKCIRELIRVYFNESPGNQLSLCCDVCHPHVQIETELQKNTANTRHTDTIDKAPWRQMLKTILQQHEET